jgi:hypothetical protein
LIEAEGIASALRTVKSVSFQKDRWKSPEKDGEGRQER